MRLYFVPIPRTILTVYEFSQADLVLQVFKRWHVCDYVRQRIFLFNLVLYVSGFGFALIQSLWSAVSDINYESHVR